jgi:hypothetical protein
MHYLKALLIVAKVLKALYEVVKVYKMAHDVGLVNKLKSWSRKTKVLAGRKS